MATSIDVESSAALLAFNGRCAPSSLETRVDMAPEKPRVGMKTRTSTWNPMPTAAIAVPGFGCMGGRAFCVGHR